MATYIESGDSKMFWIAMAIGIPLIIGAFISANNDRAKAEKSHDAAPCSEFRQETLSQLPARCVTPQGGFKQ